jgi:transcriptional regulator with XRE-family HTH domain
MISYKEKRNQFSPEAQTRINAGAEKIRMELRILRTIREASGISQEELASRLDVGQSYISRLERRSNITLATLAGIAQALGGSIEITINLPQHEPVKFTGFEEMFL